MPNLTRSIPEDSLRVMKNALWITLLVAICAGVWMGNLALGRTRGEIDYGVWHEIESRGGAGYYYLKGVDQGNRSLDSNSAMAMISQTPSYRQSLTDKSLLWIAVAGWVTQRLAPSRGSCSTLKLKPPLI